MSLIPWKRREMVHPLVSFRDQMNRLFEDFWGREWGLEPLFGGERPWSPALDVAETGDMVVVKAEVPGIDPKEIEVSATGDALTIKGEKRQAKEDKSETYHRVERTYGAFERTVPLPQGLDLDKVAASFKDGVLTITFPKKEEHKPKQIAVEVKDEAKEKK